MHSYLDTDALRQARAKAQETANETGIAQVFGFSGYSGWTFCSASNEMAVHELTEACQVQPQA